MTKKLPGETAAAEVPLLEKRDGRGIDSERATLMGEGSLQRVNGDDLAREHPSPGLNHYVPTAQALAEDPTYYDRPVLKEPVWIWSIPLYFHVGGVAGAAAVLGGVAEVVGGESLQPLARRCRWVSTLGCAASGALLVHDLGRPERFLNMLRVFRPSSPMSVGSWVVAGLGAATAAWLGASLLGMKRVSKAAGVASAALGLPMAGYTAVLVTTTAVPVWHSTRRSMPWLFVSSAAAGLGALCELWPVGKPESASQRAVWALGNLGKASDLVCSDRVEKDAGHVERVAAPLKEGTSGALWKAAKVLTAASLGMSLFAGPGGKRNPKLALAAGVAGLAGGLALRYAVLHAGKASARDPRATFHSQRAGNG